MYLLSIADFGRSNVGRQILVIDNKGNAKNLENLPLLIRGKQSEKGEDDLIMSINYFG